MDLYKFKTENDVMCKIKIGNSFIFAKKGEKLSDVLIKNGVTLAHPCGGMGTCKKCTVTVDGREELSCQYYVEKDIVLHIPERGEIISETGAVKNGGETENMALVLDIGTTTLAMALVAVDEKRIIDVITRTNPQVSFGADVVSRIDYCKRNTVDDLKAVLVAEINNIIGELHLDNIPSMYVTGNTTMLHILFGVNPSSMGVAPYEPRFLDSKKENAETLGVKNVENIISLPCISAFVGADLVCGMNYVGAPSKDMYSLLVDLGTNAEVVLFSHSKILCTSAAAGPCFEGANISCGMSATQGAVYDFVLSDNRKPKINTVAEVEAKGICGTGLVDIISELLKHGIIDETGYMECESFEVSEGVILSQGDVRQYQLAKSAVFSAIVTLMKVAGIDFEQMEKMYISGGFSAKINIENAVSTGLLPMELKHKAVPINNSSLLGAIKYICENNDLEKYLKNAEYIDLSLNTDFSQLFIDNMEF